MSVAASDRSVDAAAERAGDGGTRYGSLSNDPRRGALPKVPPFVARGGLAVRLVGGVVSGGSAGGGGGRAGSVPKPIAGARRSTAW